MNAVPDGPLGRLSVSGALLALGAVVVAGAILIGLWAAQERERDLRQWEARLGLVADTRADALARVVAGYQRDLAELAGNASLQFYLGQVAEARRTGTDRAAAQLDYLRNLVLAAADRDGYLSEGLGSASAEVAASVTPTRSAGLALLDQDLAPVVVTPGLREPERLYADLAREAMGPAGSPVADLRLDAEGRPVLVMAVAVGPVLGSGAVQAPVGVLIGVRNAGQDLYGELTRGPVLAEESEALLLALRDGRVLYLSPTRDGQGALKRTVASDAADLAEAEAVRHPGHFVVLDNYRGQPVLQVSRQVRGQDWVLAQQVDADQALSVANERRMLLLGLLSCLLLAIVALAVAAWRHGSSVRARAQAEELAAQSRRLQRQTELLHTVTDHIDVVTVLVDRESRILFANQAAAEAVLGDIGGLVGQPLPAALGTAVARELQAGIDSAQQVGRAQHRYLELSLGGIPRGWRASFIPVSRIGDHVDTTLMVLGDITELEHARRRRDALLQQLVNTLAGAVDLHDPWSGRHAARMALVTDALAVALGLSETERRSLVMAATLANIGKIMVPAELLSRPDALSVEEQARVRQHVEDGLNLLRGLDFDGPVLETIAQKQELLDGSGYPRGLKGDEITLPGRILGVANAFVALVSARAWRPGMEVRAAVAELMKDAGTRYDRKVLAALAHVVEQHPGWEEWSRSSQGS
jgi:HD-GYP domain-containing protein (c-di-GMP phosphodiesterase class II)